MAKRDEVTMTTGMEPLIRKTPGVCGGDACIRTTRIPIWLLVLHRNRGQEAASLIEDFPHITRADLVAAWAYADQHAEEIDEAIRDNQGE